MEVSLFIGKYVHTSVQHEYKSGVHIFPQNQEGTHAGLYELY